MFVFQPVITTYKVLAENGSLRLVRKYIQFLISLVFFFVLFCFFFLHLHKIFHTRKIFSESSITTLYALT